MEKELHNSYLYEIRKFLTVPSKIFDHV
jgi:hypothetical protein